jgi:hypothetical protein
MLAASLTLAFLTLCYAVSCAAAPFKRCRRCHGRGKHRTGTGRTSRPCRHCKATGWRLRHGRRAYTWWTRTHAHGNRPNPRDHADHGARQAGGGLPTRHRRR